MKCLDAKGRRVLIISDTHLPYHHPDTFKFLRTIRRSHMSSKDLVIHIGDELDKHALSFHDSDPDLDSAGPELEKSIKYLHVKNGLYETFPEMYLCESNHGSLVYRKAKHNGIPRRYIRPYHEVLKTPTWKWNEDYLLDTKLGPVYVCHGKSSVYGKLAMSEGCSAIQGHFHGKFEITWHRSALCQRFNMFVGCLIDYEAMAFHYGRNNLPKPILGVGLLSMEGVPHLIKMHLNSKGRWDGRL